MADRLAVACADAATMGEAAGRAGLSLPALREHLGKGVVWRAVLSYHARELVRLRSALHAAVSRNEVYTTIQRLDSAIGRFRAAVVPATLRRRFPHRTATVDAELRAEYGPNALP
jgi:hypothetical protein